MPLLDPMSATALLLATAPLLSLWWARRRQGDGQRQAAIEDLDTVQAWPPQAVRIMTAPERKVYETLRRALPQHMVLAQVPLSRFISVPTRNPYTEWLNRVGRLNVDLLVCDFSSRVVAAIEIRSADETARSQKRHERLAEVLRAAGVSVHVWRVDDLPSLAEVKLLFGVGTPVASAEAVDNTGRTAIPVPEMQELLAAGDEFDYHHDPVPSAFFDDVVGSPAR
jgi:hypothetical protein